METTMIQIKKETVNKLKELKKYERETYDEIINTLMGELKEYLEEKDLELSEDSKRKLKLAEKTPLSEYIDHKKIRKELLQ